MTGAKHRAFGYVRVSSREQNEDRQIIALREAGVKPDNIFMDKQSGKDFRQPQWQRLKRTMRRGDVLYVKSIDRLGRNYEEIQEQWRALTKVGEVDIVVLDMPLLDTREKGKDLTGTFIADLVLQILSYVAQTERENIKQRQAEGIAAAKARGVHLGRVEAPLPDNWGNVFGRWKAGEITLKEAAAECGMPMSSFYDRARKEMAKLAEMEKGEAQ